jgi:hypothetical protein
VLSGEDSGLVALIDLLPPVKQYAWVCGRSVPLGGLIQPSIRWETTSVSTSKLGVGVIHKGVRKDLVTGLKYFKHPSPGPLVEQVFLVCIEVETKIHTFDGRLKWFSQGLFQAIFIRSGKRWWNLHPVGGSTAGISTIPGSG